MDGFQGSAFGGSGTLGILYAEDFGADPAPAPAPMPEEPPPPPPITQADVDAACDAAVRAAEGRWAQDARERRTVALSVMAAGLAEAREAAVQQAEAVAEAVARTVLGTVAGLLPEFCRTHGDGEVRGLLRRLLPSLARNKPVVVRVHAGLIEALQADLAECDEGLLTAVEFRPANLPPGDTRLAWENGSLMRDQAAMREALETVFSELGLLPPAGEALPARASVTQHSGSLSFAE